MSVRKVQLNILTILILLLPYHYLIFGVLLDSVPGIKLWRDFLILAIWGIGLANNKSIKFDKLELVDLLLFLFICIYILLSPFYTQAMNIARVYLFPILLFHVVRKIKITHSEIRSILLLVYKNTLVLCIYGIFQAYFLGDNFLIKLGYATYNGFLSDSYYLSGYGNVYFGRGIQRVVSTFSSANIFGFYLGMVFILFLFLQDFVGIRKRKYIAFLVFVGITFVLTFSRSSWLALAISLLVVGRSRIRKIIQKNIGLVLIFVLLTVGVILSNKSIMEAIIHIVVASFSGSDTSMVSHSATLIQAYDLICQNIFGLGLGVNGPRAMNYGYANLVESSILLMVFELGIIGAFLYFMDYMIMLLYSIFNKPSSLCSKICLCTVIYVLIAYLNIPYVQEMECTIYSYLIMAITWKEKKNNNEKNSVLFTTISQHSRK